MIIQILILKIENFRFSVFFFFKILQKSSKVDTKNSVKIFEYDIFLSRRVVLECFPSLKQWCKPCIRLFELHHGHQIFSDFLFFLEKKWKIENFRFQNQRLQKIFSKNENVRTFSSIFSVFFSNRMFFTMTSACHDGSDFGFWRLNRLPGRAFFSFSLFWKHHFYLMFLKLFAPGACLVYTKR